MNFVNEIACHAGICLKCGMAVCLKYNEDCHGPLASCSKIKSFIDLVETMNKLTQTQEKWFNANQRDIR